MKFRHYLLRVLPSLGALLTTALAGPLAASTNSYSKAFSLAEAENPEVLVYVNVEGDFNRAGNWLSRLHKAFLRANPKAPPIPVDYKAVFADLGLGGMEYLLLASEQAKELTDSFHNRIIMELGGEPVGIFALLGTENQPFLFAERVPADADQISQFQINGEAIRQFARQTAIRIMGPTGQSLIDSQLNQPLYPQGPTAARLIELLSTTVQYAANLDPERFKDLETPGIDQLTGDFAYVIRGAGDLPKLIAPLLPPAAGFRELPGDPMGAYALPFSFIPGSKQELLFSSLPDSGDLLITNGSAARDWFMGDDSGLTENAEFSKFAAELPREGLLFHFNSQKASRHGVEIIQTALQQSPDLPAEVQPLIDLLLEVLDSVTGTSMAVLHRQEGRLHLQSMAPYSQKVSLSAAGVAIPAMTAAMAIPAYQQIQEARQASADKAVQNNLRQLSSAAQQYFLETGESSVMASQLIGDGKLIQSLQPVAGESYENLLLSTEDASISVTLPDGRVITYSW